VARKLGIYVAPILLVLIMVPARAALAAARSPAARVCTSWVQMSSRNNSSGDNDLNGVAAISSANVWAVGEYFVGVNTETLVEHWNGTTWKIVSSPNLGTGDQLESVYAVSSTNVWAAGSYYNGTAGRTLIEHWNGKSWKVVPSPNIGAGSNELTSVRGTSGKDIWAAGDAVTSYPVTRTVLLHWNGKRWAVTHSPSQPKVLNLLGAVRPQSRTDAWAVGQYVHGSPLRTLILHWSKGHWRIVPSPNGGTSTNELAGVLPTSAASAWAAGWYFNGKVDRTLMLHWNGKHWRKTFSPNAGSGSNDLAAIGATSARNIYAVGVDLTGTGSKVLILHWNGSHWRVMAGRNPGTNNRLEAVFAQSPGSIWAVGSYSKSGTNRTLIEHCR
jgi:hypothetical protein